MSGATPSSATGAGFGAPARALARLLWVALWCCCVGAGWGCALPRAAVDGDYLARARATAADAGDGPLGRWLLLELIAKGGSGERAQQLRERLSKHEAKTTDGLLARAIDADVHGRLPAAAAAYVKLLDRLREEARADSDLLAWYAARRLASLQSAVDGLWPRARPAILRAIDAPAVMGWRARSTLVEWWAHEHMRRATASDARTRLDKVAERHGCLREALMAGPFGSGVMVDHRVHFAAEGPGPWPLRFDKDARGTHAAVRRETKRHACLISSKQPGPAGVYYVQSFFEVADAQQVIVAVQGAHAVLIDDVEVLRREASDFGVWPRFGVRLRLAAGRHRLVARLLGTETSIRVLDGDGGPLHLTGSAEQAPGYVLTAPTLLADPNAIAPFMQAAGVMQQPGMPKTRARYSLRHPVRRYLAAHLANADGQADLASVLLEPLVKELKQATPLALALQADLVEDDPIFAAGVARDLARDLRQQAVAGDDGLWAPQLWLTLEAAGKTTPSETVKQLERLRSRFEQVPNMSKRLANVYGRLGWKVEQTAALARAVARFPRDIEALRTLMEVYEEQGQLDKADALAKRIIALDPAEEVVFARALARRDYRAAIEELRRIAKFSRNREAIAVRLAAMMERAGDRGQWLKKLRLALQQDPQNATARLALADARFARGDRHALTNALAEAIRVGADDAGLRNAIELVDGVTDLEPYRRDGLKIIAASQRAGLKLPGSAARILDYSAIWVGRDGRARMLEHEIVRIQSREGIARHVEQSLPRGVVLHLRTIKADGRIFEPEIVANKPTVTLSHLEVGDYFETEHLWVLAGPSEGGDRFTAPRWYFREESTPYHLSELVLITPAGKQLDIETTGQVPAPTLVTGPAFDVRTWRVSKSPALVREPLSAPIDEFLPSVRAGWGIDLDKQLREAVLRRSDVVKRDPRLLRIAATIVTGKLTDASQLSKQASTDERARRIYRWVVDTIQAGKERDGAKIITGKSGDRTEAFIYLCRLLGIDARLGLVRDRLSSPVRGPFSKMESFTKPAVRVMTEAGARWLIVGDRHVPYGFLPSSLRGQPAVMVQAKHAFRDTRAPTLEYETTPDTGTRNLIEHRGVVRLAADGSAQLELTQRYHGRYAIQLRALLARVPPARRKEVVEARLLGLELPGARIQALSIAALDDLDKPVRLSMTVKVDGLARLGNGELELTVPFLVRVGRLVELPSRKTPLYISERVANRTKLDITVIAPPGASLMTELATVKVNDRRVRLSVEDHVEKDGSVKVVRQVTVNASRVQPDDYPAFRERIERADRALNRRLRFKLR